MLKQFCFELNLIILGLTFHTCELKDKQFFLQIAIRIHLQSGLATILGIAMSLVSIQSFPLRAQLPMTCLMLFMVSERVGATNIEYKNIEFKNGNIEKLSGELSEI